MRLRDKSSEINMLMMAKTYILISSKYYILRLADVIVNDTLRMYKSDDIRMYNFDCITDTIVEVITTCNTYTLLTVHLL